ncbi:MarR family winged helix-turn-helix transcriptional regulator [Streptodolium elevatio]|uniref:MarR family transcriptional regulator n=1 Tax=Streptodolium elevatio TaxID=3157996 RepID=A0ABV3DIR1_9ACTN
MDKPTHLIEFETMLLTRHTHMSARSRGDEGHLDRTSYVLLSRISVEGPMSIRQLSEAFGLDASTLNRKTASLLAVGLLERIADSEGGIARKFRITREGQSRLTAERDEMVSGLDKVLADWTPAEVTAFAAMLQRFNTSIEDLAGLPWPRP